MNILYENIIYTVLLIISSIVITKFLSRFKMKTARTLFIILSIIMSLYIPFYFGGNTMISLFTKIFDDETVARVFTYNLSDIINAPFILFKSVSIGMFITSSIMFIATILVIVSLIISVVKFVLKVVKFKEIKVTEVIQTYIEEYIWIPNDRFLYKTLEKYRN